YMVARNRPISMVDPYGLWGVKICDINFGCGDPSYDFDFDKNDWKDLKRQYKCNADTSFWYAAAGNKVAATNPNFFNLATGVAADGFFFGSVIGYNISNLWEE